MQYVCIYKSEFRFGFVQHVWCLGFFMGVWSSVLVVEHGFRRVWPFKFKISLKFIIFGFSPTLCNWEQYYLIEEKIINFKTTICTYLSTTVSLSYYAWNLFYEGLRHYVKVELIIQLQLIKFKIIRGEEEVIYHDLVKMRFYLKLIKAKVLEIKYRQTQTIFLSHWKYYQRLLLPLFSFANSLIF